MKLPVSQFETVQKKWISALVLCASLSGCGQTMRSANAEMASSAAGSVTPPTVTTTTAPNNTSTTTSTVPDAQISFQTLESTIFGPSCVECHSASNTNGGYAFDSYEGVSQAVTVSDPTSSPIYVQTTTGKMPKTGALLSNDEENEILLWVQQGALNN